MPEQVQKIIDRILEWWKKFTTTQKAILVSATAGVLIALVILGVVVTKPTYVPLYTASDTKDAANVKSVLDGNSAIDYQVSNDGLVFTVNQKNEAAANLLLGENGVPSQGMTIDDVVGGGFSTTEADKQKKNQVFLEERYASHIASLENVESCTVDLELPDKDGTILSREEQASAAVMLELSGEMDEDQAYGLAKYIATQLGNDNTDHITIMDNKCNVLYSGSDSSTSIGAASTQLSYKQKNINMITSRVKNALAKSKVFTDIEVAPNLDISFSSREVVTHEYWPQDGSDVGLINTIDTYSSASVGGAAAVPGTDSNDDTTYVTQDGEITNSTIDESSIDYDNNEKITTEVDNGGTINYDNSSISVVANRYVLYDEDVLRANGELDDMTFEQYQAEHSNPVAAAVDESWTEVVANATGIAAGNITIVCYEVPMFQASKKTGIGLDDILQIALAVLIFALLGYVVFRSTRTQKEEEPEPELSVESLLESTVDTEELEDIGYTEKSETRILIEKFVEENPDAAALLLRNWLNEDWD